MTHGEKSSLEFKIWLFYFLEFIEKYIYNTIGYLELQKVHKQYKVEVDELKKKLQFVDASLTENLANSSHFKFHISHDSAKQDEFQEVFR